MSKLKVKDYKYYVLEAILMGVLAFAVIYYIPKWMYECDRYISSHTLSQIIAGFKSYISPPQYPYMKYISNRLLCFQYIVDDCTAEQKMEILSINKSLPRMIDRETRLDYVSLNGYNITYNFTLVNLSNGTQGMDSIKSRMPSFRKKACENFGARGFIIDEGMMSISYLYRDKNGKPAIQIVVTGLADCI